MLRYCIYLILLSDVLLQYLFAKGLFTCQWPTICSRLATNHTCPYLCGQFPDVHFVNRNRVTAYISGRLWSECSRWSAILLIVLAALVVLPVWVAEIHAWFTTCTTAMRVPFSSLGNQKTPLYLNLHCTRLSQVFDIHVQTPLQSP